MSRVGSGTVRCGAVRCWHGESTQTKADNSPPFQSIGHYQSGQVWLCRRVGWLLLAVVARGVWSCWVWANGPLSSRPHGLHGTVLRTWEEAGDYRYRSKALAYCGAAKVQRSIAAQRITVRAAGSVVCVAQCRRVGMQEWARFPLLMVMTRRRFSNETDGQRIRDDTDDPKDGGPKVGWERSLAMTGWQDGRTPMSGDGPSRTCIFWLVAGY